MKNKAVNETRKPLLLLVDDVAENLQVLAQHLVDSYELALASDGEQALALASETHPNLILLDVMMPGIDGYETCRQLKRNMATKAIPVIFLTARSDIDDIIKGFEAGGVDYVSKPFKAAELRARVRTHVELNRLRSLLSICAQCQKVKNDKDEWTRLDYYIATNTKTTFSHGYCPECFKKAMAEENLSE